MVQNFETVLAGVTLRRAELLALFADLRTQAYAVERMGITVSGVASQVENLKALTGCDSVAYHPHVEQSGATTGSEVKCPDGAVAAATWLYRWGY